MKFNKIKSKIILNKIIDHTLSDRIKWIYLGKNNGKYSFFYGLNVFGNKFIIIDLNIFSNKLKNSLTIEMKNISSNEKILIKNIEPSSKVYTLSKLVLRQNFEDENSEAYNELYKYYRIY
jgi:hypothetical protein